MKNKALTNEFEEFKKMHSDEIEKIKKQQMDDKELFDKERDEWSAQRSEIEQELDKIKNEHKENLATSISISYDALQIYIFYYLYQIIKKYDYLVQYLLLYFI